MDRTTATPFAASLQLAAVMIIGPLWLIQRLTSPTLPITASDILLLAVLVAWALLAKAILDRDNALDPLKVGRGTPMWFAHRLVDQSLLGVGPIPFAPAPVALDTVVAQPRELLATDLPPATSFDYVLDSNDDFDEVPSRAVPMLLGSEPAEPLSHGTQEYIVGRGDTYWSIAEASLGDGRQWQVLQKLNLGREVAPDVLLDENDELRIGWCIHVPILVVEED